MRGKQSRHALAYVLDHHGKPLMPTKPARAKKLLKDGRAKVVCRAPFTIKLLAATCGYRQEVVLGGDTGSKKSGWAAVANGEVVYQSEIAHRGEEVSANMEQRASYRRTRRGRNTRYRQARFENRRRKDGWVTPSMRSKVDSHKREIKAIKKILPVSRMKLELASFDIHAITNPDVHGKGYQQGRMRGFENVKKYILHRDEYKCQHCGKGQRELHVHHIVFRSNGGTDSPDNLITLCREHHEALHRGEIALKKKRPKKNTKHATEVTIIAAVLRRELAGQFTETFGYETALKRRRLGLPKKHHVDALMVCLEEGEIVDSLEQVFLKRHVAAGDYQQSSGKRSEQPLPTGKINGYRKFDLVEWNGKLGFIKGRMSSGYAILMSIDGQKIDIKPIPKISNVVGTKTVRFVSARKTTLIEARGAESIASPYISYSSLSTERDSSKNSEAS